MVSRDPHHLSQHHHHPHHHHGADGQMSLEHPEIHDDEDELNKSVFMRLHKAAIRNTRTHLNTSGHGEEAMMIPTENHEGVHNASGALMNEPSRIINQNEISKKPQRNPQPNSSSKLIMTQPVRLLTPDDL